MARAGNKIFLNIQNPNLLDTWLFEIPSRLHHSGLSNNKTSFPTYACILAIYESLQMAAGMNGP